MTQLQIDLITQEQQVLSTKADKLIAPAVMGEVTILPNHIPLFTRLNEGIVGIIRGEEREEIAILGGFMDVAPGNKITIMADSALRASEASEAKALAAKKKAEEIMENIDDAIEYQRAETALRQAMLELKIARRKKNQ